SRQQSNLQSNPMQSRMAQSSLTKESMSLTHITCGSLKSSLTRRSQQRARWLLLQSRLISREPRLRTPRSPRRSRPHPDMMPPVEQW
ncbi:unnamed protein product, partial [Symbiodinium pilosum]